MNFGQNSASLNLLPVHCTCKYFQQNGRFRIFKFYVQGLTGNFCYITAEEKKEPSAASSKKEEKNDSDSEDEGKKERQRFKSERPKEQHKFEKQEQSMWKKT